jgi:hypothetical protein
MLVNEKIVICSAIGNEARYRETFKLERMQVEGD